MFTLLPQSYSFPYSASASEVGREFSTEVFTDPAQYDNPLENLLGYCCRLLQEAEAFRLEVHCGDFRRTISVYPHLVILLLQLREIATAIASPEVKEVAIDFFEQGFSERVFVLKNSDTTVNIMLRRHQAESVLRLHDFKQMLLRLVKDFASAIQLIDDSLVSLPTFTEWYSSASVPLASTEDG